MIAIAGRVKIKPGRRAQALVLARQIATPSQAEGGCLG